MYLWLTFIISCQKTIDLRDNSKNALGDVVDEDADTQTIFEAERPATFDHGAEQTSNNSIKVCSTIQQLMRFVFTFLSPDTLVPHSQICS